MNSIRAAVNLRRRQGQFAVAMNYGIAKDALEADGGTVSPELTADFTIANRIAPTLSRGLRGNPRQLKRFLNTMLLRLETARRRSVNLDPAILAKLMVLEAVAQPSSSNSSSGSSCKTERPKSWRPQRSQRPPAPTSPPTAAS
jgi:hypothetical protein